MLLDIDVANSIYVPSSIVDAAKLICKSQPPEADLAFVLVCSISRSMATSMRLTINNVSPGVTISIRVGATVSAHAHNNSERMWQHAYLRELNVADKIAGCSRRTIERRMRAFGQSVRRRFSSMSDQELIDIIGTAQSSTRGKICGWSVACSGLHCSTSTYT